ncbi:PqqD family protein [uncultured Arcticibacterium sp.]|uniref:PqqD family protein n=1 Tax=uncultured Arcticibacterium sp. TaxID=2173042 RepID=UPI0030F858F6
MNYKVNTERILFSPLGEEAVVFDREKNEYITLNETMFKIFQSIHNNEELEAIKNMLVKEYNVDMDICSKAIERALSELSEKGFILKC